MTIPVSPFSSFLASGSPMAMRPGAGAGIPGAAIMPGNLAAQPGNTQGNAAFFGGDSQSMMQMLTLMMGMMGMMMLMMMGLFSQLLGGGLQRPTGEANSPGGQNAPTAVSGNGEQPPAANQPAAQAGGNPPQPAAGAQPPAGPPAAQTVTNIGGNNVNDPNLNLERRGYSQVGGPSGLTNVGGPTDPKAPQLASMFRARDGMPQFSSMHQIYGMDKDNPGGPLAGIATRPGQEVLLPRSGYQIDGEGHQARVLYNDGDWLVVNYTAGNSIAGGYTLHIKGLNSNLQPGTNVSASDVLGTAQGQEILFSIRDTGSFMDPRVQKDWWQNTAQPA